MAGQVVKRYVLGEYWLEPEARSLVRDGEVVHLANRPLQVLLYLIENRDRLISRHELLEAFWEGRDVYDDALRKSVGAIRRALCDRVEEPRFIETRWAAGYRYVGPLEETFVRAEPAVYQVERTRGLKIIVHEEVHDRPPPGAGETGVGSPSAPAATEPTPVDAPRALAASSPPRRLTLGRRKAGVALSAVLVVAAVCAAMLAGRASRAPESARPAPAPRSLAVLPLENLTGDPANDYMSDGITESLISSISRVEGLRVISRSSVFALKGKGVDARQAGESLGVAAILEGGLRKSGDRLRVDVRLVSTGDGRVLWASGTNDRPAADIFAVQDEIARKVMAGLAYELSAKDERRLAGQSTRNVEAYQEYLKGRYHLNKRARDGIERAADYFRRAVALDPDYALAYAALAESYDKFYWLGFVESPPQEVMAKQRAAATKALALDDSLAETHIAMGSVYNNEWDLVRAARELERAIEIDPRNAEARHNYAYRLLDMGRPDEAVAQIKLALELDPLNVVMHVDVAEILLLARRYDEAITAYRQALEMDPNRANAHEGLAWAYEFKGMYDEAVAAFLRSFALNGRSPEEVAELGRAYESGGIRDYWRKSLEQELRRAYTEPVNVGNIYTRLGDKDKAFAWYEKAYRVRSPSLVGAKSSAKVDSLRSDPRYADLVRRVGLP
jgi:TolB-like protein/DNA-binding winged helix-turn-helix (wHTH) protein/Flp pilus assembly protein TadD